MKKIITILVTILIMSSFACVPSLAAETGTIDVYVTIADNNGKLALAQEKINVKDSDADGKLTVNDVFICAHNAKFTGGAVAGYATDTGAYGLFIKKLWGIENGGSYGYYINNKMAYSLVDEVKSNDYINAYAFKDLTTWSDKYCFFDKNATSAKTGRDMELKLSMVNFDSTGNAINAPVSDAIITINGETTEYKTDSDGKVILSFDKAGNYAISATSSTLTLVPNVCNVQVLEAAPQTGDNSSYVLFALIMLFSVSALVLLFLCSMNRKQNEN